MLCNDVKSKFTNITTVSTLEGQGDSSISIHADLSVKLIKEAVKSSIKNIDLCHIKMPEEFNIEISFKESKLAYRASFYSGVDLIDNKTITFNTKDYYEFLRMFMFIS